MSARRTGLTRRKATRRKATPKKASRAPARSGSEKAAAPAKGGEAAGGRRKRRGPAVDRRVYSFGDGTADGDAGMRDLLGGKGANLAEMTRLGIPVPPGFTISTEACLEFRKRGGRLSKDLKADILTALARVESIMDRRFGDSDSPLLVSVRSGARDSMPGMMDTVLNLGLNDRSVKGLAATAGPRFAFDSYRRFIQMYGNVVLDLEHELFEKRLESAKRNRGAVLDTDLSAEDLEQLVAEYLELVEEHAGQAFPQDPRAQLWGSVGAVFRSWDNDRARTYRRLHEIPDEWGTAVNVQAMVFGNMGEDCATGVAFTRDPSSGERVFYGEYLTNAQGEDVVAGIRTPQPINEASRAHADDDLPSLEREMPASYRELVKIYKRLEKHYRDMQDIEFTIQQGTLWMLQTRNGKRTPSAAVQIAVDMVRERLITRAEAVRRVDPASLEQLLHPTLDPIAERHVIGRGLPASPGAAVGAVVFSADAAEARAKAGEKVVLVREETSPDDIHGMHAAEGILTARGGMTSHAAVVARGMGKCCVTACDDLKIAPDGLSLRLGEETVKEGEFISVDGSAGEVMLGRMPTVTPQLGSAFGELMGWADRLRKVAVRTNADTPQDAIVARQFGAEGIGLCRTEHMFFEPARITAVRGMILADDVGERERALADLLPMQRGDFVGIFRAMDGLPVTIRLLDPPLHEFLPSAPEEIADLAAALDIDPAEVRAKVARVREFNPMLGHRGCRLGVSFPEIYGMQVRAIAEAACEVMESGVVVKPEIMVPLVAHPRELALLRDQVERIIAEVRNERGLPRLRPLIGTMIEVPRAALVADKIARYADFFSFGTNDLTQMAYALSRDDAGRFLIDYLEQGILEDDPFVSLDREGVGQLVDIGVNRGRQTRPHLKVGVCGEHGGDPRSVEFFARHGLDYVSCSPYRVPVARLAAAQAAVGLSEDSSR